jgi:hypothetical protein
MTTQAFQLADRAVGGRLAFLLRKWKSEGLNREEIAKKLAEEHGISLTGRTIHNWLRHIEREEQAS